MRLNSTALLPLEEAGQAETLIPLQLLSLDANSHHVHMHFFGIFL